MLFPVTAKTQRRAKLNSRRPSLESLEGRKLMAVGDVFMQGTTLVIESDGTSTHVEVSQHGPFEGVTDKDTGRYWNNLDFGSFDVEKILFRGSQESDTFYSEAEARVVAHGNGGNDFIEVHNRQSNVLVGGPGNDVLVGSVGNDWLYGGYQTVQTSFRAIYDPRFEYEIYTGTPDNDVLIGGRGNDQILLKHFRVPAIQWQLHLHIQ